MKPPSIYFWHLHGMIPVIAFTNTLIPWPCLSWALGTLDSLIIPKNGTCRVWQNQQWTIPDLTKILSYGRVICQNWMYSRWQGLGWFESLPHLPLELEWHENPSKWCHLEICCKTWRTSMGKRYMGRSKLASNLVGNKDQHGPVMAGKIALNGVTESILSHVPYQLETKKTWYATIYIHILVIYICIHCYIHTRWKTIIVHVFLDQPYIPAAKAFVRAAAFSRKRACSL